MLAWQRRADGDERRVLVNFTGEAVSDGLVGQSTGWAVRVSSDGRGEAGPFGGTLRPDQAVMLAPAVE